jgi:hypothetical protein
MTSFNYRDVVMKTTFLISKNEIRRIIKNCKFDNILNSNEISNRILKISIKKLFSLLTNLFQARVEHNYHLLCFRKVNIIILKKLNKNNYTDFKTYKFIILLNTIDKTFKIIIVRKINIFAKIHEMFFATQIEKTSKKNLRNDVEIFHWTNSHDLKHEQKQNNYVVKHKRRERIQSRVTKTIHEQFASKKNNWLNNDLNKQFYKKQIYYVNY